LKRFLPLSLALTAGLLLWAAWPVSPMTYLLFIAWIPLLWVENTSTNRKKFFGYTYITMFIWNVATTWWIWNASIPGAVAAFLANSLLMCLPWLGFSITKKWLGNNIGYISLVVYWMAFEYIHVSDWGLSWPWLTLGNGFSTRTEWIQWYEYTGTSGGTLWILLVNILLFLHLRDNLMRQERKSYRWILSAIAALILPLIISRFSFHSIQVTGPAKNVVVVQPNIDPYEKIYTGTFEKQLQILISNSEKQIDDNTALVVWPETALYMESRINETDLKSNFFLAPLWGFLQRHPSISLFTGIESFRTVDKPTKYSETFDGIHYESYNGSVLMDSSGASAFYHKSMLVPGVETLPWFLRFIKKWFDKFGGTTGGYAKQKDRTVLSEKNGFRIAPAICYESIYGEYMSKYIKNGANIICIITNDGWWGKTPGHKQHLSYARLRAIETRTWVARSANTGISCFIDPNGVLIDPQPYDTVAAIKLPVAPQSKQTFFTRYGDLLSKTMLAMAVILIVWVLGLKIRRKFF
jgi:apolipoprotein N-acyltransferase